ncbi:OsmC family protein [Mucilaginibacter sp.]|uniref:OsmC family protein n=1 Tax=Mucilaginibacter sp. TaxID=1882438 RepID=UPI0035BC067D
MDDDKDLIASADATIGLIKYQTRVSSGGHSVVVDEPVKMEGMDSGMAPYGLLLASLASCTAITLRMYINRKMWVIDEIGVDLELSKTPTGVHIDSKLSFKGELNDEQRLRLVTIADACPIHKLLVGEVEIFTALK